MPEHVRKDGVPKKPYRTKKAAKRTAQKHMKIYKCSECGQFHLATKTPRSRDRT